MSLAQRVLSMIRTPRQPPAEPRLRPAIRYLFFLIVALALLVLAPRLHPTILPGSAELDYFTDMADKVANGERPVDLFRPIGYVWTAGMIARVTDDTWMACQIVSVLSAVACLALVYALGHHTGGEWLGWWACLITAANWHWLQRSFMAATDMYFTFFVMLNLYACARIMQAPNLRHLVLAALSLAAAQWVRYTSFLLILPMSLAVVLYRPIRESIRRLGLLACLSLLAILPHAIETTLVHGSPFYNENWRNIEFHLYGNGNWDAFFDSKYSSGGEFIRENWRMVLVEGGGRLEDLLNRFLPLISMPYDPLRVPLLYFLVPVGVVLCCVNRRCAPMLPAMVFCAAYSGVIVLTIYLRVRFFLPVLPILYIVAGLSLKALVEKFEPSPLRRQGILWGILLVVLAVMSTHLPREVARFYWSHFG